jgi:hypothetical protein
MPHCYRLSEQILAVRASADHTEKLFQYVPAGAVIVVAEDHLVSGDLITVQWESETVWMFRQDIENRTELLVEPLINAAMVGSSPGIPVGKSHPIIYH